MRIAVPLASGKLCAHFGHCEQMALLEVDEQRREVVRTTYLTPPPHEPGVMPTWLHELGANVVICGGMGKRAQEFFRVLDIHVVVGAPAETPEKVAAAFLKGSLAVGENICDH